MNIIISNNALKANVLKPFTPHYDKFYVSFNEEQLEEKLESKLTENNMMKLLEFLDFSWDGSIYWFKEEYNILKHLDDWFAKKQNHLESDKNGIFNCFLIKKTPHGVCLIDTQFKKSSTIEYFLKELKAQIPNLSYNEYSASHLIGNLYLGQHYTDNDNEFSVMYLLYKEKVIDSSFFLKGISSFYLEHEENKYYRLLPHDKEIVIIGELPIETVMVLYELTAPGYKSSEKITDNSWLWYGDNADNNVLISAKENNIVCSSIDEVIEGAYQKYLNNLNNQIKLKQAASLKQNVTSKKLTKKLEKNCFKPIVEIDESNLEYNGSKYFGKVWLANNEKWPQNSNGKYLTFVFQLDISTLPAKYKKDLGKDGLVQFFFDSEYEGETLIRIVKPDENGYYHEQPLNQDETSNYFIDYETQEKAKQKIIKSWESHIDMPHYEEELSDQLSDLVDELRENSENDDICAIQGDKLGGYAFWTQSGSSSEELLFQIDAGSFYDGKAFEAHAPNLFAGDGTAHIFYDKKSKSFSFHWACG